MEEKRAPLSEMAIERKIQILRNEHMDCEVIALVKSDYEYGLTDDEIGLYLNKSYDIEQMKVLSKCLHKGVSEELLTLLKDSRMAAPKMQTALDYYEKGVPIDAIREVVQKDDTAVNMRRMFDVVLEKLNKAKEQTLPDFLVIFGSFYFRKLLIQGIIPFILMIDLCNHFIHLSYKTFHIL